MYCKDCKYWERHSEDDSYMGLNRGKCHSSKFIDVSDAVTFRGGDTLEYSDYDSYKAQLTTGENFGCIHFEKKVN